MFTAEVLEDFEPNFGLATYSCPLDIYTALPGMLLMRSKRDEEDRCIWCMMLPLFVGFIFSVVAQIASLVYIYVLIVEMKLERLEAGVPACSGGDYFLRIICNCACFATIAQSLKESMNLRTYIALMPKLNPEHIPILKNFNASFVSKLLNTKYTILTNPNSSMIWNVLNVRRPRLWEICIESVAESLTFYVKTILMH